MTKQSVDAAASTSNQQKKLTNEEWCLKWAARKAAADSKDKQARSAEYNRQWRAANKERIAQERIAKRRRHKSEQSDAEQKRKQQEERAANKKAIVREQRRKYYKRNKSKLQLAAKQWRQANQEKMRSYHRQYKRTKRQNDPVYKLCMYHRSRLRLALSGKSRRGSAVRDMGCTGQQACDHLESLFDEHMTWDNWGTYWHVDHIYPLSKANLEDRVEFLAVNNWRNLQPLEATANMAKGDTVTPEAQKLFDDLKTQFLKEDAA